MGDWLGPVRRGSDLTWGKVLQTIVAIDAFLVLAGSVLTSYVGLGGLLRCVVVSGLVVGVGESGMDWGSRYLIHLAWQFTHRRLALDRCFPQVVLQRNSWRGTHHIAIFGEEGPRALLWRFSNWGVYGADRLEYSASSYMFAYDNPIPHRHQPGFFVVASSLLMILDGDVEALAGKRERVVGRGCGVA